MRRAGETGLLTLLLLLGVGGSFDAAAAGAAQRTFPIVYVSEAYPGPGIMPSLLETHPADEGLAGAREGTEEINTTGRFLGWNFKLYVEILPAGADIAAQARRLFSRGPLVIVADLRADDLLKLADAPAARGSLIIDMRTSDDDLRQRDCRSGVFHVLPNQAMRVDALAQFLVE